MCEKRSGPGRNRPKSANNNRKEHRSVAGHVTFTSSVNTFAVYQPQVDNWPANLVNLYCAVELKTGKQTASKLRLGLDSGADRSGQGEPVGDARPGKDHQGEISRGSRQRTRIDRTFGEEVAGRHKNHSLDQLEAALEADSEAAKGVEVKITTRPR
jgi:hypothetical protein